MSHPLISDAKVLRYYFNLGLQVSAFKMCSKLPVKPDDFLDKYTDVFEISRCAKCASCMLDLKHTGLLGGDKSMAQDMKL